jgi:branched-chain amino acid transport system permease protein
MPRRLPLAGLLAVLALMVAGAARADDDAIARCRELLPVFVDHPGAVAARFEAEGAGGPARVRLSWSASDQGAGFILCWFLPHPDPAAPWQFQELDSSRFGKLSRYDIQQAFKMLHVEEAYAPQRFESGDPRLIGLLYFMQQAINGISLGCVYALIALGYTLVFGITRVINFAWGPLYAIGAFMLVFGIAAGPWVGPDVPALMLLACLALGMAMTALWGWAMERVVFRPLRHSATTAPLIAAIGLAIALQELIRLAQGPRTRYLLVSDALPWPLVTGHGFDVYLSPGHAVVGGATLVLMLALWWLQTRTVFGRSQRACAQDVRMAALLGVDVDRTVGLTFLIGGALVGAAGVFAAGQYGVVSFKIGALVSLKALAASIIGGIGSLPGAVLGGVLVALIESFTAGYIASEWKEVAVFVALVLILCLRPEGLLGTPKTVSADERL